MSSDRRHHRCLPPAALHIVIAALCWVCAPVAHLEAQEELEHLLAGRSEKTWVSVSVESGIAGDAMRNVEVTFKRDHSLRMREGETAWEAHWSLQDDGSAVVATERTAGGIRLADSLWMELLTVEREWLTLEYRNGLGRRRVQFKAEPMPDDGTDTAGFASFWIAFRNAVAKGDRRKAAAMTSFPFFSYDLAGFIRKPRHGPQYSRAEFLRYFSKLFNASTRRTFHTAQPTPMTHGEDTVECFAVGIRRSEHSMVWVEFRRNEHGEWKLTRTDNVSGGEEE